MDRNSLFTRAGRYQYFRLCNVPSKVLLDIYYAKDKSDPELYQYIAANLKEIEQQRPELCRKVGFLNESSANNRIKEMPTTHIKNKGAMRAYICPVCSLWHLTSQPKKP